MCATRKKNDERFHPTQKPIALYEWLLSRYAKDGDIILDTHVGSASSLIACYNTNHKFVGFELDEHYYKLSKERLDREMSQKGRLTGKAMGAFFFLHINTISTIKVM